MDPDTKMLFTRLRFLFIPMVGPVNILLVAHYFSWKLPRPLVVSLFIIPSMTAILALSPTWHNLLLHSFRMVGEPSFPVLAFQTGPWFHIHALHSYAATFAAIIILSASFVREHRLYRVGAALIIIALLIPSFIDVLAAKYFPAVRHYQLMPASFTLCNVAFALLLFRFRAHDILPVAKRKVFSMLSSPVLVFDGQRRLVDFNTAADDLLFRDHEKPLGSSAWSLLEPYSELLQDRVWSGDSCTTEIEIESDGQTRIFELKSSPLGQEGDGASGVAMVLHEITERKEMERQILERDALKAKFLSLISHDLSGNVANLTFVANVLDQYMEGVSSKEARKMLRLIQDSSQSMHEFLRNLLDWSRRNQSSLEMNKTENSLLEIAEETLEYLSPVAKSKGVHLKNHIGSELKIFGDRDMILAILRNLVSNAIKFTSPDGTVALDARIENRETMVSVRDSGVGLRDMNPETLFSKFSFDFQKSSGAGYGLGLTICKQFVENHGGRIFVESPPYGGCKFTFALPLSTAKD